MTVARIGGSRFVLPPRVKAKIKTPKVRVAITPKAPKAPIEEQEFFIHGKMPGLNEMLDAAKDSGFKYNAMKKRWSEIVLFSARMAHIKSVDYPVHVHYTFVEPNRRRDKDNIAGASKFILDALQEGGILTDDGWRCVTGISLNWELDKQRPGVRVTLSPRVTSSQRDGKMVCSPYTDTSTGGESNGRASTVAQGEAPNGNDAGDEEGHVVHPGLDRPGDKDQSSPARHDSERLYHGDFEGRVPGKIEQAPCASDRVADPGKEITRNPGGSSKQDTPQASTARQAQIGASFCPDSQQDGKPSRRE